MDYNEVYGLRGLKGLATHTVWKKVLRVLKVLGKPSDQRSSA